MSLLLAAVRDAGLILCLSAQTGDPCTVSPIVVEAEVAPAAAAAKGRFSWRVDGKEVYSGILTFEGGRPQRVAMVLEPRKPEHLVSLEVKIGKTKSRRDLRLSRAICPFLLQLEDFSLSPKGVELVVTNRGPFPSGPGVLEWRINGVRSHRNQVDSIPPGGRALFLLPAETSGMLEKALTQLFLFGGRRRVPVVVSARLEFAPNLLYPGIEQFDLVAGYLERAPYFEWRQGWWNDLDQRPVQRFPEFPPQTHLPPPPRR
ncbi:hypothetical protein [Thermoanaerobaculum aquaticum]|nr:hypothetical protein [Thermoanaerobaculum aquaticum]